MSKGIHKSRYMLNKINHNLRRKNRKVFDKGFFVGVEKGIEKDRKFILGLSFFRMLKFYFTNRRFLKESAKT